jgi:hypothetical protein
MAQSTLEAPCKNSGIFKTAFGLPKIDYLVQYTAAEYFYGVFAEAQGTCHNGTIFAVNPGDTMELLKQNAQFIT